MQLFNLKCQYYFDLKVKNAYFSLPKTYEFLKIQKKKKKKKMILKIPI